jgi:hypothetical protein
VVAVSNFNEAKEKRERLELKGAPATPGVANLMHLLNKRYSFFFHASPFFSKRVLIFGCALKPHAHISIYLYIFILTSFQAGYRSEGCNGSTGG